MINSLKAKPNLKMQNGLNPILDNMLQKNNILPMSNYKIFITVKFYNIVNVCQ